MVARAGTPFPEANLVESKQQPPATSPKLHVFIPKNAISLRNPNAEDLRTVAPRPSPTTSDEKESEPASPLTPLPLRELCTEPDETALLVNLMATNIFNIDTALDALTKLDDEERETAKKNLATFAHLLQFIPEKP